MHLRPPRGLRPPRPWLAPLVYCVLAIALGMRGPDLGVELFGETSTLMGSDSAIALLAAVGTGMMALTGVVFSLVFVALQFGTTAYSPRLADEVGAQKLLPHALGIFSGTFLYSILAIRAVDLEGSKGINVPAIWVAFGWLVASVVVLVMLVPQIQTLSIANVLDHLGRAGREGVDGLYPAGPKTKDGGPTVREGPGTRGGGAIVPRGPPLVLRHLGPPEYLLGLHTNDLVRIARRLDALLRVRPSVGDPIFPGDPLVEVLGASPPLPERAIRRAILTSKRRTVARNPMYALRLLVDIAIRSLSPAVNDPTTTVMALDQVQSILTLLGESPAGSGLVADGDGIVRLEVSLPSWEDAVSLSLTEIALYGGKSPQVQRRLGSLLADLIERLPEARRPALRRIAQRRRAVIEESFPDEDRREEALAFDRQGLGHTARPG